MHIIHKITPAVLALCLLINPLSALERTAVNDNLKADVSAIEMRMDTKLVVMQTLLNRLVACNTRGLLYSSNASAPGRDADGCIPIETGTLTYARTYNASSNGSSAVANHTLCVLTRATFTTVSDNHGHACQINRVSGGFRLQSTATAAQTNCSMMCYDAE